MADTSHTLRPNPQRDEAEGYRPVSALAVAALAVAMLTVVTVAGIWITAKMRGRPILVPAVLFLAAAGVVLAAVARWQVGRSLGTRTGLGLARVALWLSLLSLGGYGAYLAATGLAVRQQAQAVADQFFSLLSTGKPELAFRLTRPPAQQRGIEPDPDKIRARFGSTELFVFNGGELARTFRTWGADKTRVQFVGEHSRDDKPDGFEVDLNYGLRTPEGEYDIAVGTRGIDDPATGGRDWQVVFNRTGFRQDRRFTKLGRMCAELQVECARRYLPQHWLREMSHQKPEETAEIVRVEGAVPRAEQRPAVVDEVRQPDAINLFPGAGPMRNPGLPTMRFSDDGVRLRMVVEVKAPTVDKNDPKVPADLTIQVINGELVREMLKLAGPNWEREPAGLTDPEGSPELEPYGLEKLFRVTELNLRPSQPRIAPAAPNSP